MKKNIKILFILLFTLIICFPRDVEAAVEYVSADKLIGSQFNSTTASDITRATGSRQSSTYGIRVSLVKKEGNTRTTIAVRDVLTQNTRNVNSKTNKLGSSTSYSTGTLKALNTPVVSDGNSWNLDFGNIANRLDSIISEAKQLFEDKSVTTEQFRNTFSTTSYYSLIYELAGDRYQCDTNNFSNCNDDNIKKYISDINKLYIIVEPISTVAFGSLNAWYGGVPLTNKQIDLIKNIGTIHGDVFKDSTSKKQAERMFSEFLKMPNYNGYIDVLYDRCDDTSSQFTESDCNHMREWTGMYVTAFNRLVEQVNNIQLTFYTGTSTNIANEVKNNYSDTNGKRKRGIYTDPSTGKEKVLDGSLESNVSKVASYLLGVTNENSEFGLFTDTTSDKSWANLRDNKYSLGVQLIHIKFKEFATKCTFENGKLNNPMSSSDPYYCCDYTNVWSEFADGKKDQWTAYYNSEGYKICSCTIKDFNNLISYDNDATTKSEKNKISKSLIRTIRGKTTQLLTCCYEENYDETTKETIKTKSPLIYFVNGKLNLKVCGAYCTYEDTLAKDKIMYTNNGATLDCCDYNNYGNSDSERTKNSGGYSSEDLFKQDPKYKQLCVSTCAWNPRNPELTPRMQQIGGIDVDCCTYENWGSTDAERKTNTGYTKFYFEDSEWYKKSCPNYCTPEKLLAGDISCCSDLSKYSDTVRNLIATTPGATLKSYLLSNGITESKYKEICGGDDCSYGIDSYCPDCDNDSTNNARTMDTVLDEDATKLDVSEDVLKCIFNNKSGGDGYDSYFYPSKSNRYCNVYCTQRVEYNFPKRSTLYVTAGRYITVGAGGSFSPISTSSTMTCRIERVNESDFRRDLETAKTELIAAYKEYSHAKVPLDGKGITLITNNDATTCACTHWKDLGDSGFADCCDKSTEFEGTYSYETESFPLLNATKTTTTISSSSACTEAGGNWITTKTEYVSEHHNWGPVRCGERGGSYTDIGKNGKTNHDCVISGTKEVSITPYCTVGSTTTYSCNADGYSKYGEDKCIYTATAGKDCTGTTDITCKYYKCSGTNGSGFLKSSSSSYGYTTSPKCVYEKCDNYNYERFDYQYVNGYNYGLNKSSFQWYQGNQCEKTCGTGRGKTCNDNPNYYETEYNRALNAAYNRLRAAKAAYEKVISDFKDCLNFGADIKPEHSIDINLDYQNGDYSVNVDLAKSPYGTTSSDNIKRKDYTINNKCQIPVVSGGFGELTCNSTEVLNGFEDYNKSYSASTTNAYNYSLPSNANLYRFVSKSSESIKDKQSNTLNVIAMGSHLPVAYDNKNKTVDMVLKPIIVSTGIDAKNKFEQLLCKDEYECTGITPHETGIIPVYRPISLSDPFPNEDDNGRNTGKNWCSGNDCSNKNDVVTKVITTNRGVSEDQVYNLTPLYTIKLTPGVIKEIKEYNSSTTYGDYNLICETDTGRRCLSRFLRALPDENNNYGYSINNYIDYSKSCALNKSLTNCYDNDFYEEKVYEEKE